MAGHTAGDPLECYSIPLVLEKEPEVDEHGNQLVGQDGKPRFKCGFRIGGGIDQDNTKSPQGYPDKGIYVTYIHEGGPAQRCGLQTHDKILQPTLSPLSTKLLLDNAFGDTLCNVGTEGNVAIEVNGHDFTLVTHRKAVEYIQRKPVLNMLVYRKGLPKVDSQGQTQFQAYAQDGYPMQYQ